jgi:glutathione S-transferase
MLSASAKGTVPVLELPNGKVLDESLDIMHWALGIHDPEHWLTPPAETLQDVDAIVAVIDGQFKYHLDRYKYASRYQDADPDSERDAAAATLRPLVARLEIHSHLFGERPCFADIAAAPFVRQFANTDRAWFDAQSWTGLRRWLDAFLGSEMFNQVMTKYPLWRRDDPTTRFPS